MSLLAAWSLDHWHGIAIHGRPHPLYQARTTNTTSPNRSYNDFALHLHTNTIGPIICAQKLLTIHAHTSNPTPPSKIIFISSDSGSTTAFRDFEDGFGAYAASKAALNQMLRHMAAELRRKEKEAGVKREGGEGGEGTCVLALHPGEVAT